MTIYDHIGVAVTFSPRINALLAEAAYRAEKLARRLSIIHAGARTPEKEARLAATMEAVALPPETPVHWLSGPPAPAILRAMSELGIDFLVTGAVERGRGLSFFRQSVTGALVHDAPGSLLLFTEPMEKPDPIRRIVVVTDYSEVSMVAFTKALRFAEQEGSDTVYALRVVSQLGENMAVVEGMRRDRAKAYEATQLAEEAALLEDFVEAVGFSKVPVEPHVLHGRTGYAAVEFVRRLDAGLLVIPSTSRSARFYERLFPSEVEWVLRDVPCNLWVERERLA